MKAVNRGEGGQIGKTNCRRRSNMSFVLNFILIYFYQFIFVKLKLFSTRGKSQYARTQTQRFQ